MTAESNVSYVRLSYIDLLPICASELNWPCLTPLSHDTLGTRRQVVIGRVCGNPRRWLLMSAAPHTTTRPAHNGRWLPRVILEGRLRPSLLRAWACVCARSTRSMVSATLLQEPLAGRLALKRPTTTVLCAAGAPVDETKLLCLAAPGKFTRGYNLSQVVI